MRCFLALPLAEELRDSISEAFSLSEDVPRNLRRVDDRLWHLTLAFLGNIEEMNVGKLVQAYARPMKRPGTISIGHLETFPQIEPKLIVASGEAEPAGAWNEFVETIRKRAKPFAPEMDTKPWRVHITIGRSANHERFPRWNEAIGPWNWKPQGFELVQSTLTPQGSAYRTLHAFPFKR